MKYVPKIGTKTMTDKDGLVDQEFIANLAKQVSFLWQDGVRLPLVVSGAVALGYKELGWGIYKTNEINISDLQFAAAVGQSVLMSHLYCAFAPYNLKVGQYLYTHEQLQTATSRNIIKSALLRCLDKQSMVVPIINENDVITDEELKKIGAQGDNDVLCYEIAKLIGANKVIYMTNVDGIKTSNKIFAKQVNEDGIISHFETSDQLIAIRKELQQNHEKSKETNSNGGMLSKFEQANNLNGNGIPTWIVNGRTPDVLLRIHNGEQVGTVVDLKGRAAKKTK